MAASSRFGAFKPESEHETRGIITIPDRRMDEIIRAWHRVGQIMVYDAEDMYYQALGPVKGLDCTREEVEAFSLALCRFGKEETFGIKTGLYLSALINNSPENGFTIHTAHLDGRLHYIGCYNHKDIVVKGPAGDLAGMDMGSGSLIIDGDCGANLGLGLRGGLIRIEGNTKEKAGFMMNGGKIFISGDAGPDSGFYMKGGELHVDGRFDPPQFLDKGRIYHKGVLAWPPEGSV